MSGDCRSRACSLLVDGLEGCAAVHQQHRENELKACSIMLGLLLWTLQAALTEGRALKSAPGDFFPDAYARLAGGVLPHVI